MFNSVATNLKYFKRRARWENSTGTCTFDPKNKVAYSYSWWVFVKKIRGKVVFNHYTYSSSTSKHQSAVSSLMRELKIKVDLVVYNRESLSEFTSNESPILERLYEKVFLNEFTLTRKGLTKKTKDNAQAAVDSAKKEIKVARSLGAGYPKNKFNDLRKEVEKHEQERLERNRKDRVKKVFSKELKEDLKNLGEIDFLTKFNDSDKLDPINMAPTAKA